MGTAVASTLEIGHGVAARTHCTNILIDAGSISPEPQLRRADGPPAAASAFVVHTSELRKLLIERPEWALEGSSKHPAFRPLIMMRQRRDPPPVEPQPWAALIPPDSFYARLAGRFVTSWSTMTSTGRSTRQLLDVFPLQPAAERFKNGQAYPLSIEHGRSLGTSGMTRGPRCRRCTVPRGQ